MQSSTFVTFGLGSAVFEAPRKIVEVVIIGESDQPKSKTVAKPVGQ
jgi:hypothetical protein